VRSEPDTRLKHWTGTDASDYTSEVGHKRTGSAGSVEDEDGRFARCSVVPSPSSERENEHSPEREGASVPSVRARERTEPRAPFVDPSVDWTWIEVGWASKPAGQLTLAPAFGVRMASPTRTRSDTTDSKHEKRPTDLVSGYPVVYGE
jgi:hypothetical protein